MIPRALTFHEKKTAEAAFSRLPFRSQWGTSALKIYQGITNALSQGTSSLPPHLPSMHHRWRIGLQQPQAVVYYLFPPHLQLEHISPIIRAIFPRRPFSLCRTLP